MWFFVLTLRHECDDPGAKANVANLLLLSLKNPTASSGGPRGLGAAVHAAIVAVSAASDRDSALADVGSFLTVALVDSCDDGLQAVGLRLVTAFTASATSDTRADEAARSQQPISAVDTGSNAVLFPLLHATIRQRRRHASMQTYAALLLPTAIRYRSSDNVVFNKVISTAAQSHRCGYNSFAAVV